MDSILVATRAACLHTSNSTITVQANGVDGREVGLKGGGGCGGGEGGLSDLKMPVEDCLPAASVHKPLPNVINHQDCVHPLK